MTMLDIALSYAARGWPVFPARAKEEVDPHTGEILAPKTPLTSNGLRAATVNERIIREWWTRAPDAMVAIPTGAKTGVFVLDLDRKPGVGDGHDWLADQEAIHGALPDTARASTMGDGTHIFFNHVEGIRNRGGLGVAVDIRGEGGYVIAPGSQAADGRAYAWHGETAVADAPGWLIELLLPPARHAVRHDYTYSAGGNQPYVERAMEDELRKLATGPAGGRGHQLNASAYSLGQLVAAGALSRQEAEAGLYDAAAACGVLAKDGDRETWAKIRRGMDAGARSPREIPERQEDNTRLVDVKRMIANGLRKAKSKAPDIMSTNADVKADSVRNSGHTSAASVYDADGQHTPIDESISASNINEPISSAPPEDSPVVATPFAWIDPKTLPLREFAYGTH